MVLVEVGRLYFAYGCNMDSEHLSRITRMPIRAGRAARAAGWRLTFDQLDKDDTVVANLVAQQGCTVYGVVYRLPQSALPALDEYERVPELYEHVTLWVEPLGRHARQAAFAYVGRTLRAATTAEPAPDYLERLVHGAREHGLPGGYIEWFRSLARGEVDQCYRSARDPSGGSQ